MRVVFGTDESTAVTRHIVDELRRRGAEVDEAAVDLPWPEVGHRVGRAVADGSAELGVVCCYTGTGVSMAANKVPGVRAALCTDAATARGARRWNDANVLGLSLRLTSEEVAGEILEAFLGTGPEESERANIDRVEPVAG